MSSSYPSQLDEYLKQWADNAVNKYEAKSVYLFGSLIYKGGGQFCDSSDIDLVVVMPVLSDAITRHRWLENFSGHKEEIEIEAMRLLHRTGDEPSVSVVAVTHPEIEFDIHKDGHSQFFKANTFRNLITQIETEGIDQAGIGTTNRFIKGSLAFAQKIRNEHFAVSANRTARLSSYDGPDPLPKRIMRAAAMVARACGQTKGPGAEHDVQEGLDILSDRLYNIRDEAALYRELQDLVSVRRNARGKYRSVNATHQLLLAELIYDIAIDGTASISNVPKSPKPDGPAKYKGEPDFDDKPDALAAPRKLGVKSVSISTNNAQPVMPFGSSTAFFAERFASAFPGVRETTWYDDPDEIATRLLMLFKAPLSFSDATPIWWWRGGNLHIERFEQIKDGQFIMNVEELNISRIAAVPNKSYKRHFVYVQTDAMASTGLYNSHGETRSKFLEENGYDYEEFGLLHGGRLLTRAEYDDGRVMIEGKLVDVVGQSELRVRYISPYNFVVAAHGSPINNNDFDGELEDILNAALKGNAEEQVEKIKAHVKTLPLLRSFDP